MAQETQEALYQPWDGVGRGGMGREMGGSFKRKGIYVPMAEFILRFDRKQQNSVKQLSFNKK